MISSFIRKLDSLERLPSVDRDWLQSLALETIDVAPHKSLIEVGENPEHVYVVIEGLVVRCKITFEGRRQIFAYLLPGDCCDFAAPFLKEMDHSLVAVARSRIAKLSLAMVREMTQRSPALLRAVAISSLVDTATLREWLVNLGQRSASQRLAHLFSELHVRMEAVGMTDGGNFALPVTQEELADTMGFSNVHANRSLRELRERGLVTFRSGVVEIPDVERLNTFSSFKPTYLHLNSPGLSASSRN